MCKSYDLLLRPSWRHSRCVNLLPGGQCWVSDSRTVVTGRSGLAKKPPAAKGSFCPRYLAKLPSPRPQPASRLLPVQVLGSGRRRLPTP